MISLIAAVATNGVIGNGNAIPWHLPEDFKHFSSTTKGNIVVMGRKTWDSLPPRFRPLPGRTNIVISRQERDDEGAINFTSWEEAIAHAKTLAAQEDKEVYVIGGASIYQSAMEDADRLVISEVDASPEGDVHFPEIGDGWTVKSTDQREGFAIKVYERG